MEKKFKFIKDRYNKETDFQTDLAKEIRFRFPNAYVFKTDPSYLQGAPDLIVLISDKWFALECKVNREASPRPNQEYYISDLGLRSYSSFVYPENAEEVLYEIQSAL